MVTITLRTTPFPNRGMGLSGSTAGETLQDAEFDFRPGPQEDVWA